MSGPCSFASFTQCHLHCIQFATFQCWLQQVVFHLKLDFKSISVLILIIFNQSLWVLFYTVKLWNTHFCTTLDCSFTCYQRKFNFLKSSLGIWQIPVIFSFFYISLSVGFNSPQMMFQMVCHTIACFHVISISLISSGDYPCAHYFFVWILPLCALFLCSMTHYDITMADDVARDAPLWHNNGKWCLLRTYIVTPQWIMTLLCVHNMASQWIMTLLGTSFARYYYAKLWYCCFTSKRFKIVHINH